MLAVWTVATELAEQLVVWSGRLAPPDHRQCGLHSGLCIVGGVDNEFVDGTWLLCPHIQLEVNVCGIIAFNHWQRKRMSHLLVCNCCEV